MNKWKNLINIFRIFFIPFGNAYYPFGVNFLSAWLLRQICTTASERSGSYDKKGKVRLPQFAGPSELRAVGHLVRLWKLQGEFADTCDLIAPVYSVCRGVTGRFDTDNSIESMMLFDELDRMICVSRL